MRSEETFCQWHVPSVMKYVQEKTSPDQKHCDTGIAGSKHYFV